jgi:hypothetical protein
VNRRKSEFVLFNAEATTYIHGMAKSLGVANFLLISPDSIATLV